MEEEGGEQQQQRSRSSSTINNDDDNDDGSSNKNQPTSTSKPSSIEDAIENLDCIISRFGDASFEPYYTSSSSSGNVNVDDNVDSSSIINDIIKKYTPIGLEESFQQLFTTIQPSLVPTTTTTTSSSRTTTNSTKATMTASAILMGPRGSGKTLLIERCLLACQELSTRLLQIQQIQNQQNNTKDKDSSDEQQQQEEIQIQQETQQIQHTQRKYRKVYINGILIRGEDVQSVIFEIIRQLNDIALQEKKEQRRINKRRRIEIETMKEKAEETEKEKSYEENGKMDDIKKKNDNNEISNKKNKNNGKSSRKRRRQRHVEVQQHEQVVVEEDLEDLKAQQQQQQQSKRSMKSNNNDDDHDANDDNIDNENDENDDTNNDNYLLRVRQNSSFTSNLSLLETTLKISEIDQLPIILILDELDCFTDEGERQLLLYYLFDKVATPGSNLCLLSTTTNFSTLSLLEKRIRSRAEGTSKIIHVKKQKQPTTTISYDYVMKHIIIQSKLNSCFIQQDIMKYCCLLQQQQQQQPQEQSEQVQGLDTNEEHGKSSSINIRTQTAATTTRRNIIYDSLQRAFNLGKDIRWFSRVISCALSMYRYELVQLLEEEEEEEEEQDDDDNSYDDDKNNDSGDERRHPMQDMSLPHGNSNISNIRRKQSNKKKKKLTIPKFQPHYLIQALLTMGATIDDDFDDDFDLDLDSRTNETTRDDGTDAAKDDDNNEDLGEQHQSQLFAKSTMIGMATSSDLRIQALLDLSTPQIAMLLCARRIQLRDRHHHHQHEGMSIPLTIQRMFQEYESSYRGGSGGSSGSSRGSNNNKSNSNSNNKSHLLWPTTWQLLERGLLVPSMDHSGGGALQYNFATTTYKNMDSYSLSRIPMHVPVHIDHELGYLLKRNNSNKNKNSSKWQLDCPTELAEWGRKSN